jgi:hypothetical protein
MTSTSGETGGNRGKKQEFLDNFRVARNLFVHHPVRAVSPQLDPQSLERRMARGAVWLTPRSVAGSNAADFGELGPDRQRELDEAVGGFLAVANQIPPTAPVTADQLAKATAAFGKLVAILTPYLPTHEEADKMEGVLMTVNFPEWVANWDYEFGSDADGLPAVWVTVFADEQSAPMKQLGRLASELAAQIRTALSLFGIERWPFVRMRTAVEHKSMV